MSHPGPLQLGEIASITEKKKALKGQLNFQKNVLLQKTSDQIVFCFQVRRNKKTVQELTEQLCKLIEEAQSIETSEKTSSSKIPLLVGKCIKHKLEEKCSPLFPVWQHGTM